MFLLEIIAAFYTFLNQEPAKELDLRQRAIVPDELPGVRRFTAGFDCLVQLA
jgi:hypothetical protein